MCIELTRQEKRLRICNLVREMKDYSACKIRKFSSLVGLLMSACPATKYGLLYTKILGREKYLTLILSKGNYDRNMAISTRVKSDLSWWLDNIDSTVNPIRQCSSLEIFKDASLTGWGEVCNSTRTHGRWSTTEQSLHINQLELIAAFYGLRCFAKDQRDCEIRDSVIL